MKYLGINSGGKRYGCYWLLLVIIIIIIIIMVVHWIISVVVLKTILKMKAYQVTIIPNDPYKFVLFKATTHFPIFPLFLILLLYAEL